ncbi:MAG: RcnB family protein [Sphingobium sp.]
MFRKFLMALSATAMVVSPMVASQAQAAPHRQNVRVVKQAPHGRTVVKQRTVIRNDHRAHRWSKGQRFDRRHSANYRVVNNYRDYRLSAPPRGYQWVQSGNDAVLVAITSGIIGAIIGGALR